MSLSDKYQVQFHDDGCAVLTMKNGQNRFNLDTLKEINNALDKVEQNPSCRVLITTGEGKFYSNGIDLDWLLSPKTYSESGGAFMDCLLDTLWRVMHFPLPTVAAINGHAFAGGAFLALCHDYRVMRTDRGWISWNETLIKMRIREKMREVIVAKLDSLAIRESVIFAKRVTGPEARSLRIIDSVTTQENLISEAKSLGFGAVGKNDLDREVLKTMKQDMFPRRIVNPDLNPKL